MRQIIDKGEAVVRLQGARFDFLSREDLHAAIDNLSMMPGCWAVEMCPEPHEQQMASGLWTIARDEWEHRPDAGIVIATAWDATRPDPRSGELPTTSRSFPTIVGRAVVVDHTAGQRLEGAVFGDYHATSQVRLMGIVALSNGYAAPWPWRKSILMIEHPDGLVVAGGKRFAPDGEWVLVARDGIIEKSEGGIFIPDGAKQGACKGTVVQVGPRAFGPDDELSPSGKRVAKLLEQGDRIQYVANLTKRDVRAIFSDQEGAERLALVHVSAILATLPTEKAPDDYLDRLICVVNGVVD